MPSVGWPLPRLAMVVPCVLAAPAPLGRRSTTRGYLAVADRLIARLTAVERAPAALRPGGRHDDAGQRRPAVRARDGGAARPPRAGARNDARARPSPASSPGPEVWTRRRRWRRSAGGRAGLPSAPAELHPVYRDRGGRGARATRTRARPLGLEAAIVARDPRRRSPRRARARLALAGAAAQPVQLVRHDVRRRRAVNGTRRDARRRPRAPPRAASVAAGGAPATSGRACASTTCPRAGRLRDLNFDSPEYANIVLGFARVYGPARAAGMPPPGAARPAARVGAARARRLLDARRLPELGHRPRLRPLAPAQEGRARPGRADRRRGRAELQPSPRYGAWAKWMLDRASSHYVELPSATAASPAALAYGVNVVPQHRGNAYLAAARYAANAMRALRAGLGHARRRRAARAVRLRPRHRPAWRSRRPRTTRRSSRSTTARSRTAGSTSRGCSTAARRSRATSAG